MLINANALAIPLANKSVHTIVTSPPYYGLRDYGTATWQGGDPDCTHRRDSKRSSCGETGSDNVSGGIGDAIYKDVCQKCGAIRIDEQIGLEVTPDAYIANLVEVFRECKRILRDDGTLWVNIGDSYFSDTKGTGGPTPKQASNTGSFYEPRKFERTNNMKPKDLIGIPWMLAFALRADGWYLRQDIIWAKPNPMPESVKDRCTKSHEYIFLLSKSPKYYYDNEAIMEVATGYDGRKDTLMKGSAKYANGFVPSEPAQTMAVKGHERWRYKNLQPDGQQPNTMDLKRLEGEEYMSPVRNKRDVWTVTTKPYKGAHYATFNPDLIKPCILAGAPETCCAKCGAPYVRVVEHKTATPGQKPGYTQNTGVRNDGDRAGGWTDMETKTLGFQPTCSCNAGTSSGIVFDPFVGSGTTVATAIQLGRKGIGLDLSFKYLQENAKVRIEEARLPLLGMMEVS